MTEPLWWNRSHLSGEGTGVDLGVHFFQSAEGTF